MRKPALIFALIAAASVVGFAKYHEATEPGANIRIVKTAFTKDQERIEPTVCASVADEIFGSRGEFAGCEERG